MHTSSSRIMYLTKVKESNYPCTHPVPRRRDGKGVLMTIGIGLVCDGGKSILLTADMRGSYGNVTSNDQTGKLFDLPFNFCGAVAGKLSQCIDVMSELHHRMSQLTIDKVRPEPIRNVIRDSFHEVFIPLADETLRAECGITLDQYFHDTKIVRVLRRKAQHTLKALDLDVYLIVAGFCDTQPLQFIAEGGRSISIRAEITPGNAVIGSGSLAALEWLNYRNK